MEVCKSYGRQKSCGLTGETFYDYDVPLYRDDPITIVHFNDVYNIQPSTNQTKVVDEEHISPQEGSDEEGSSMPFFGGISRFVTAVREHGGPHPLTLFSGDAFNPSIMSTYTRGRHMIPFLNMLRIHTAVFGNHDFDFGIDNLEYLAGSTRFPWLISNVCDAETHEPLANGSSYRLFEWQGTRVGIIGLVEREWLYTLSTIDQDDVIYEDFVDCANRLSLMLRGKECELIIALTHMRAPNDARLAIMANDIDLILGGHDHDYYGVCCIGNSVVCKSGSDFREFTKLVIHPGDRKKLLNSDELLISKEKVDLNITCNGVQQLDNNNNSVADNSVADNSLSKHIKIIDKSILRKMGFSKTDFNPLYPFEPANNNIEKNVYDDPYNYDIDPLQNELQPDNRKGGCVMLKKFRGGSRLVWSCITVTADKFLSNAHVDVLVGRYWNELSFHMDKILVELLVPLETRFSIIRTQETNCGDWLCDLVRKETRAQIAFLNSGTLRSDKLFLPGLFRLRDLTELLPMVDSLVVLELSGEEVLKMLEIGVSMYPRTEGRFLQISGLKFSFDPNKPPGSRVVNGSVFVQNDFISFSENQQISKFFDTIMDESQQNNTLLLNEKKKIDFLPLDMNTLYTVATKQYIANGKDGFAFLSGKVAKTGKGDEFPPLPTIIRNALSMAALANGYKKPHNSVTFRKLQTMKQLERADRLQEFGLLDFHDQKKGILRYGLAPQTDGRITCIQNTFSITKNMC